MKRQKDKR